MHVTEVTGVGDPTFRMMNGRHLTDQEKARILAEWERTHTGPLDTDEGGCGYPDPDMIPWCAKLNAIPEVCTVQSCAGHGSGRTVVSPGHLWLRLGPSMDAAFDRAAFRLSAHPCIERVARVYTAWGEEITSITFAGNERNLLAKSLHAVLLFFRSLQHEVTPMSEV